MKKFIALLLVALVMLVMCFSLAACDGEDTEGTGDTDINATDGTTEKTVFGVDFEDLIG